MSLGRPLQLMRSLRKSPSILPQRFRHDRAQALSHGDPLFKVHYLGSEKIFSLDLEQAEGAIVQVLARGPAKAKLGKEHALVVRPRYLEVKELSSGRQLTKTYLRDVAYCAADAHRPNVFLYICKQQGQQLHCRVFWCSRPEKVKDMTACLARSFQRALRDLQDGPSSHRHGEDVRRAEPSLTTKGVSKSCQTTSGAKKNCKLANNIAKSCTLPTDLNKGGVRRKLSTSRSPLRELMRRASISD